MRDNTMMIARQRRRWCILMLAFVSAIQYTNAFSPVLYPIASHTSLTRQSWSRLNIIPLKQCHDNLPYFTDWSYQRGPIHKDGTFEAASNSSDKSSVDTTEVYELCVVEETDLPDLSRFIIASFGADAIRMSQDLNTFETLLVRPAIDLVNGYSALVAFAEVLAGLNGRLERRLKDPSNIKAPILRKDASREEHLNAASRSSLVLVLAKEQYEDKKKDSNNWHVDIIASVELRLEPSDAKIPFTLPILDTLERKSAQLFGGDNKQSVITSDLQPYLSNLCVDSRFQGQGIGRSLVKCVEDIAQSVWGYDQMYLHVDPDNKGAIHLYKSENYGDVGRRWKTMWTGAACDIGYYVKQLGQA